MNRTNSMFRPLFPVLMIMVTSFLPVPVYATVSRIRVLKDSDIEWLATTQSNIARVMPIDLRKETEQALKEANAKLAEWEKLAGTINAEREQFQQEKETLTEERKELERDKRLFKAGFFATFSTTFIGFAGLIIRIPNSALDKQLKRIQIAEKMHELKEKKISLPE